MAAEKQMNSRIQLKNDIEANWLKAVNFIPKLGEVIIYNAEKEGDELPEDRIVPIPYPRIKIGNNETNVSNLPFIDDGLWEQISSMNHIYASDDGEGNVSLNVSPLAKAEEAYY